MKLRATSHTRDWEPVTICFKHSHWWKKAEPVQVHFTLRSRDQRSMWMQDDGCKVYMDSYMASTGSCFVITWTIFENHLLEVGLPQHRERPWHSERSQPLIYYALSCVRTRMNRNSSNSILVRARSHVTSHYTWESVSTLHDFGGVSGRPLDTFFWALTISWSRLLARVWSGP